MWNLLSKKQLQNNACNFVPCVFFKQRGYMHIKIRMYLYIYIHICKIKLPQYEQGRWGDDMLYYIYILSVLLDSFTVRE